MDNGEVDSASPQYRWASALAPGVVSAVGYRYEGLPRGIHLGIPTPSLTFIFSTEGPVEVGESVAQALGPDPRRARILIGGLHTAPAYVVEPGAQAGVQMAVHPLAARSLFGVPAAELHWMGEEGGDVLGAGAKRLLARLQESPDRPPALESVATYLRSRHEERRPERPRPELVQAWRLLARSGGNASMRDLAAQVMLSQRHLATLFHREMGLGPKAIARLMRFTRARRAVAQEVPRTSTLAQVAHRFGYADQSHLVRDFQQFTGRSPTQWLSEEFHYVQAGAHTGAAW